jgi:hypothetical protein
MNCGEIRCRLSQSRKTAASRVAPSSGIGSASASDTASGFSSRSAAI